MKRYSLVLVSILASACGDAGGSGPQGSLRFSVQAVNAGSSTAQASGKLALGGEVTAGDFVNSSIASGPPETFSLRVRRMSLRGTRPDGTSVEVPVFDDAAGKRIAVTGSRVDLSDMFTHYDCIDNHDQPYTLLPSESCDCGFDTANHPLGRVTDPRSGKDVCPYDLPSYSGGRGSGRKIVALSADEGSYDMLRVDYDRRASISGCVTGNYGGPESTIVGLHTYCTQAAHAFYAGAGGGQNVDFEDQEPGQEMDFDLAQPGRDGGGSSDTLTAEYPIEGGLALSASGTASLTLMIDVNRMLRFYNQAIIKEVNPGAPSLISFFFTTVFNGSVYVFAGAPGEIGGYELVTRACIGVDDANVPPDYVCGSGGVVAAWLTLFSDAAGRPFAASFMPDDDNTLTVIKGGNLSVSGSGSVYWDSALIVEQPSGSFDIGYRLGTDRGTLINLDTAAPAGTSIPDVAFRGLQKSYGTVTVERRL
jgi:hypothetical protein